MMALRLKLSIVKTLRRATHHEKRATLSGTRTLQILLYGNTTLPPPPLSKPYSGWRCSHQFTNLSKSNLSVINVKNISNVMCYNMLCMLEQMRKRKHRGGTLRTQGLRGSALRPTSTEEFLKGYIFIVWECSTITCVTMNPNISIYRRLNPRLLVQAGMGLGLLHWANISNIYL